MAINFPASPTTGQTYTFAGTTWSWNGFAWDRIGSQLPDIVPLDDISNEFNDAKYRFIPRYQGQTVSILNPLSILLTINGIIQYVNFPEYVWMSAVPRRGFFVDSEGQIQFSEAVPAGSDFDARIMSGNATITTRTRIYPFKPLDILLGG